MMQHLHNNLGTLEAIADHLLSIRLAGARFATFFPLLVRLAVLHLSGNWESDVYCVST